MSDNIKWVLRKKFQNGLPNSRFRIYGYHWEGWQLAIEPYEAGIVRKIYKDFIDGKHLTEISNELNANGVITAKDTQLTPSGVRHILTNSTYLGNLLLQKTFISDPICRKQVKNLGELPQYFIEGSHQPIISKKMFDLTQNEFIRRRGTGFWICNRPDGIPKKL